MSVSFHRFAFSFFTLVLFIILLLSPYIELVFSQETPQYGGRFKVGWLETLDSLKMDDTIAWSLLGNAILSTVYEQLAFMGKPPNYDEFTPMLASEWEVSDDFVTWTFYLSPDAKWHDGTPVTAEDVDFTAKYLVRVPVWNGTETDPASVEVIDDNTVRFVMKQPIVLVVPFWWVPILPKHIWWDYRDNMLEYDNSDAIGSGPFKLKEWIPGEYFLLEANTEYHLGRPYIDELLFRSYTSEDAIVFALLNGEIDMIVPYYVTPSMALQIINANDPNVDVREDPGDSFYWLTFNLKLDGAVGDLLRNIDFRKAIAYAIDKNKIVEVAFQGYANAVDVPVYEDSPYYNPDITRYSYDPERAVSILNSLGLEDVDEDGFLEMQDGSEIELNMLIIGTNPIHTKIATSVREDLQAIGIKLTVDAVDEGAYWTVLGQPPEEHGYDLVLFYQAIGPDITFAFTPFQTGGWANVGGFSNPDYDNLLNRFISEPDRDARIAIAKNMQEIIADELPAIFLINPSALTAYRTDKFEGFVWGIGGAWTWFSPWTFREVHLKEQPEAPPSEQPPEQPSETPEVPQEEPEEAPDNTWLMVAAITILFIIGLIAYLKFVRKR